MMREFVTRWGRRNLGFAWLFAEPLVFAFPVIAIWSIIRPRYELGIPMIPFVWSCYMPLLIFRHITSMSLYTVKNNAALLYHAPVTPLDLFVGRQGLEAIGNLGSVVFSFAALYAIGALDLPADYTVCLIGFLYMTWWSLAVAMLVAAMSERSELVEYVWLPIAYIYIIVSGTWFSAGALPTSLRQLALAVDPPLHAYEMIRSGLFGAKYQAYYSVPYLTYLLLALSFVALWSMSSVRQYVKLE